MLQVDYVTHEVISPTNVRRVAICVANELVRIGLRTALEAEPDLEVTAESSSYHEIKAIERRLHPDALVVELGRGMLDSVAATRGTGNGSGRPLPLVALATRWSAEEALEGLRLGVRGIALMKDNARVLVETIRVVANGQAFFAPSVTGNLIGQVVDRVPAVDAMTNFKLASLTQREREVLALLASGKTTAEIALQLSVSRPTVKSHVSRLLAKLDLRDRVQAAVFACRAGLQN
jgi:DNA-binding NarL/FixJ family response regulator